jgi:peptidyl-dipeptidase A
VPLQQTEQKQLVLACRRMQQTDNLFRCRKLLVLAGFEREIYRDPDQDPDLLWQKLNLNYLGIDYPVEKFKGYWAANKYSTSLSCTTHNLVLADVFAAQLQHTIENRVLKNTNGVYTGNKAIGQYLTDNLYRYGNILPWEQVIEKATGEPLHSKYFVNQLVGDENDNRNTEN